MRFHARLRLTALRLARSERAFWLVDHLRAGERFLGVWIDLQGAREQPDPAKAMRTVLEKIDRALARDLPDLPRPPAGQIAAWLENPATALQNILTAVSAASPRPLVVLFDEADGLVLTPDPALSPVVGRIMAPTNTPVSGR